MSTRRFEPYRKWERTIPHAQGDDTLSRRSRAHARCHSPDCARHACLAEWLLQNLADLQAQTPLLLTVENMPRILVKRLGILQRDVHEFWYPEAMRPFPALTMDTTHFGVSNIDILEAWQQLHTTVRHIHLSDEYNGREHLFPGEGTLPLADFLNELSRSRFGGNLVVELHPYALHAGRSDEKVRDRIHRASAFCREHLHMEAAQAEPAGQTSR